MQRKQCLTRCRTRPLFEHGGKPQEANSLLRKMDLFKGLEPTELALFFNEVELKHYPAGSIVFAPEDSSCERLYILKEGQVDRYRLTASGKRLVTRQIQPGSVFGVMGLLGRTMQGNFAEATEDSDIYVVTRQHVLALLKRQPDVTLRMLEIVGNRLRLPRGTLGGCILQSRQRQASSVSAC